MKKKLRKLNNVLLPETLYLLKTPGGRENGTPLLLSKYKISERLLENPRIYKFKLWDIAPGLKNVVRDNPSIVVFPDDPYERCGYLFLNTEWLFGLWGKKDPLQEACKLHDQIYGDKGELERKDADLAFLRAALKLAQERGGAWLKVQAYIYYAIVRATGWLVW